MTDHQKLALVVIILTLTSFATGRWTAPVHIEIKTVEVEKKSETQATDVDKDARVETTVTEETKPDGTKTVITQKVVENNVNKETEVTKTDENVKNSSQITESGSKSKVTISALAGFKPSDLTSGPSYGMSVTRPILGPITLGLFGLTNPGVYGVSVGLTF